jgi:hypothetical protein
MAYARLELIAALRSTAARIEGGATFRWTHMGACTCGHLAQTLTALTPAEIHRRALERRGDWSEQADDVCGASGLPIDEVHRAMLEAGLELRDIAELERLSGPEVLRTFPVEERQLDHRDPAHVVRYLRAFADLLEARLVHDAGAEDSGLRLRARLVRVA